MAGSIAAEIVHGTASGNDQLSGIVQFPLHIFSAGTRHIRFDLSVLIHFISDSLEQDEFSDGQTLSDISKLILSFESQGQIFQIPSLFRDSRKKRVVQSLRRLSYDDRIQGGAIVKGVSTGLRQIRRFESDGRQCFTPAERVFLYFVHSGRKDHFR